MAFNNLLLTVSYTLAVLGLDLDLMVDSIVMPEISEPIKFMQIAALILVGSFCSLPN